ncbi:SLAM family member 6-like [Cyprinus carpio]|uniref:SLAM family member 6-like n=1 Tax=Cyprinus carpio TaxID=7962 RepID=A0A9R0B9X0_CYPCA|nr:SLAM family member 6-like [Cyprinus carpio]
MMVSDSLFCTLWMLSLFGQYLGEDLQFSGPANGAVGGSVVFAPDIPPSTSINTVQWHFGSTPILTALSDSTVIFPAYRDRVSFDINTFALELRNLRLEDSGTYRLTVVTSAGAQLTGETTLQVFENITNVRLIGPEEFLCVALLFCKL